MTPLQLEILIHYKYSAADYRFGDFAAPAIREAIDWFVIDIGMLAEAKAGGNSYYLLTGKGHFFVDQLCAMPLPVSKWVME